MMAKFFKKFRQYVSMKKLLILSALIPVSILIFFVMSPSTSAGWSEVTKSASGDTVYYVDFERIRKRDGYVYYWELVDYLEPTAYGQHLSNRVFYEADCGAPRKERALTRDYYTQAMGQGTPKKTDDEARDWQFPPPNSVMETIIESVCEW